MTFASIGSLTALQQNPDAATAAPGKLEPTPEQRKVARDFEAIFMRQLLGSMEKAGGLGGASNSSGAMYRSMMVGALADSAAEGGGIGLAEIILQAMLPPTQPAAAPSAELAASSEGPVAAGSAGPAALTAEAAVAASEGPAALTARPAALTARPAAPSGAEAAAPQRNAR